MNKMNISERDNESNRIKNLRTIASFLRKDALEMIVSANSGHIGGSLSSVELLTAIYFGGIFKFDINNSKNPNRDKVLVRGHLGPIRYAIFSLMGYIQRSELLTYRQLGSRLQ
jgi:transketolase